MLKKTFAIAALSYGLQAFAAPTYNMIIGTNGSGAYVSNNNGQAWVQANLPNSPYINVESVLVAQNTMLVGVADRGVYVSNDAGKTWTLISTLPQSGDFNFIDLDGSSIFVGASSGLYRSDDMGVTWKQLLPIDVLHIAFRGQTVFVAGQNLSTSLFYVGISSDSGNDFTTITPQPPLSNPAIIAIEGSTLFLGTGGVGLYASQNYGQTWQLNSQIPIGATYNSLVVDPINQNEMFLNTNGGYGQFISTDGGVDWTSIPDLANAQNVNFAFSGQNVIASSSLLGGFVSQNLGLPGSWAGLQPQIQNTDMMRVVTAQDNYVLMSGTDRNSQNGLTYLSRDGGLTWAPITLKTPNAYYMTNTVSISNSGT